MKVKTLLAVIMSFGLLAFMAACDDDDGGNNGNNNNNSLCGNGVIDDGEVCDGTNIGNKTCPVGQVGVPTCNDTCTQVLYDSCLDAAEACGNGQLDDGEECDGDLFSVESCNAYDEVFKEGEGTLKCTDQCKIDTSECVPNYRNQVFEECDPGAKNQEYECAPNNDMPSECLRNGDSGFCLQTCTAKEDCGYAMDCVIPNSATNHNLCYIGFCGPAWNQWPFGSTLNGVCKFSNNAEGFCVPIWHAIDESGFCLENGTVEHGGTCDATDYMGQKDWPADKTCNAGNCVDVDDDGQGSCLSFCDPVAVYNAFVEEASKVGDGTDVSNWADPDGCPADFNCVNFSNLDLDTQNQDGSTNTMVLFREPDYGICYPAADDVTVDASTIGGLLTCDVISQRQIRTGEFCPENTICSYVALGTLIGACMPVDGNALNVGDDCEMGGDNLPACPSGSTCFLADPYNDPNWDSNPASKCVKFCQVDDLATGRDATDPACAEGEVCLSVSNFFTPDHGVPTGTDPQGQTVTETSPSPLGFCVPAPQSNN